MKWLEVARSYNGLKEYPGAASNPTILAWAKALGSRVLGIGYDADAVPWCGLFVAHCVAASNLVPASIAVRASSWATWGVSCKPQMGALVVFVRPGGGHVGFLTGQNATSYRVLGGNQSDTVSETWIAKSRAVATRWPAEVPMLNRPLPRILANGPASVNEA